MTISLKNTGLMFLGVLITLFIIFKMVGGGAISIPIDVSGDLDIPKDDNMELLFRGIAEDHTFDYLAENGVAKPFGGKATIMQHNDGDTRSPYTSWTKQIEVALKFATTDKFGDPCDGWILVKYFYPYSFNYHDNDDYDMHGEKEVLIKGIVEGCMVIHVSSGSSLQDIYSALRQVGAY